jgi:hypothetical protein
MTRPLGASIGDLLSQPTRFGGLGLGATITSVIFLAGIFAIVLYFTFSKRDRIKSSVVEEKEDAAGKGLIWQTVITVALFMIAGVSAYYWRQNTLQKEIKPGGSTITSKQNTQASPLGDLSVFIKITEDTRQLVIANNLNGAKSRVADLEYEWDNAQSKLKPMNTAKWTEVDDSIDKVLRQLRTVNPNQQDCKSSLDALLAVLK